MLMTSDQGLARMTLAEGMHPLFFDKNYSRQVFGTVLTGTCFYPFIGVSKLAHRLYSIPFTELLWELAVTFGSARVVNKKNSGSFEVCAIRENLSWSPFHAKDDLLWVKWDGFDISKTANIIKKKEAERTLVASPEPDLLKGAKREEDCGKRHQKFKRVI